MRSPRLAAAALAAVLAAALLLGAAPGIAAAQSLRGSPRSLLKVYNRAVAGHATFHRTPASVRRAAAAGRYVRLASNRNYRLAGVSSPYVRPATRAFLDALAPRYRRQCGQPLVVTSAIRPTSRQPRNGSPLSVHPTGMALDLRRPRGACLTWLRRTLLTMERSGRIDATEERFPAHFHVAVLDGASRRR